MIFHKQASVESVTALLHSPALTMILGVVIVAAGLAMILGHNVWSGNAPTVVVTLVGWLTLIKGLFFLLLPPDIEADFFLKQLHYQELFYPYMAISLIIGLYLTYQGFKSAV
jgi:hypothetical protein